MSSPNPLSFNAWVQTIGSLAVELTQESGGVYAFVDAPLQQILPQILAYAESRIARDLDLLSSQTSNTYSLTMGQSVFAIPAGDFWTIQTAEIVQISSGIVVTSSPLTFVSKEFIQNCYSGIAQSGMPRFAALYGDQFGSEQNTNTNILLGPPPNYTYSLRVTGTAFPPSLYINASSGLADTAYTYISQYYPDMLVMSSMIFISAYQRNFSAQSDQPDMGMSYEKQYQALRLGAIAVEDRRKAEGSGWSSYSTPTAATPTR
jgi:hypothetical protein